MTHTLYFTIMISFGLASMATSSTPSSTTTPTTPSPSSFLLIDGDCPISNFFRRLHNSVQTFEVNQPVFLTQIELYVTQFGPDFDPQPFDILVCEGALCNASNAIFVSQTRFFGSEDLGEIISFMNQDWIDFNFDGNDRLVPGKLYSFFVRGDLSLFNDFYGLGDICDNDRVPGGSYNTDFDPRGGGAEYNLRFRMRAVAAPPVVVPPAPLSRFTQPASLWGTCNLVNIPQIFDNDENKYDFFTSDLPLLSTTSGTIHLTCEHDVCNAAVLLYECGLCETKKGDIQRRLLDDGFVRTRCGPSFECTGLQGHHQLIMYVKDLKLNEKVELTVNDGIEYMLYGISRNEGIHCEGLDNIRCQDMGKQDKKSNPFCTLKGTTCRLNTCAFQGPIHSSNSRGRCGVCPPTSLIP